MFLFCCIQCYSIDSSFQIQGGAFSDEWMGNDDSCAVSGSKQRLEKEALIQFSSSAGATFLTLSDSESCIFKSLSAVTSENSLTVHSISDLEYTVSMNQWDLFILCPVYGIIGWVVNRDGSRLEGALLIRAAATDDKFQLRRLYYVTSNNTQLFKYIAKAYDATTRRNICTHSILFGKQSNTFNFLDNVRFITNPCYKQISNGQAGRMRELFDWLSNTDQSIVINKVPPRVVVLSDKHRFVTSSCLPVKQTTSNSNSITGGQRRLEKDIFLNDSPLDERGGPKTEVFPESQLALNTQGVCL